MRSSSTDINPFDNQVTIDHIWSFLPGKDLLNCRLVAKQNWNSASVRRLKRLKPFNRIKLKDEKIVDYSNFLSSRDKLNGIEWYPEAIKYNLSFSLSCTILGRWNGHTALNSANKIVQEYGTGCLESVSLDLPDGDQVAMDLIEKLIRGANLQMLNLCCVLDDLNDIPMVTQILNSVNSINTLVLRPLGLDFSTQSYTKLLLVVFTQNVHQNVFNSIEQLKIIIPKPSCYESLAKIYLPNLKRLTVGMNNHKWRIPDDLQHFKEFVKFSCPSVIKCEFKQFSGLYRNKIIEEHMTNFKNSLPNIDFSLRKIVIGRRRRGN